MELKLVAILVLVLVCVAEGRSMKKKTAHARSFGGIAMRNQVRSSDHYVDLWFYYTFFNMEHSSMRPSSELDQCVDQASNDDGPDGTVNMYNGEACVCELEHRPCGSDFEPVPEDERIDWYEEVPKTYVQGCIDLATLPLDEGSIVNEGGFVECLCDFWLYPCHDDYYDYYGTDYYDLQSSEYSPDKKEWGSGSSEYDESESGDYSYESGDYSDESGDYSYDSSSYYEDKRTASSGSESDGSGYDDYSGDYSGDSDETEETEDSDDSTSYSWTRMNENKRTELARKAWKARNMAGKLPQQKRHGPAPINAKSMQELRSHLRASGKHMRDFGGEHKNSERMMTLLKQLRELKSKKTSNHQKN